MEERLCIAMVARTGAQSFEGNNLRGYTKMVTVPEDHINPAR